MSSVCTNVFWAFKGSIDTIDFGFYFTVCIYNMKYSIVNRFANMWLDMRVFHDVKELKCLENCNLEILRAFHRYHRINEAMFLCHGTIKLQGSWPFSICSIKRGLFALTQKNRVVNSYKGCHLLQWVHASQRGVQCKTSEVTLFGPKQS